MIDSNLPDDCQGNNPNFPWNEPEPAECPRCNSAMTEDNGDLVCDDEFNEYCDHVIYGPDEDCF